MEFIGLLSEHLGALIFGILGIGAVVAFGYAGWLYQTSMGDQQQMMKARNAFFGGVIGLLIGGFSFVIPQVISSEILAPSGGEEILARSASGCDDILRNRLAVEIQANTRERMQELVGFIQVGNQDGCGPDLWDPVVAEDVVATNNNIFTYFRQGCFGQTSSQGLGSMSGPYKVGGVTLPSSFVYDESPSQQNKPRPVSSRDSKNNILVYFGILRESRTNLEAIERPRNTVHVISGGKPTGGSSCWLFLARENVWVGN